MSIDTRRIKEVSLLQHDSTDCGAACLASVIRYFGGKADIEKIRRLSGTSQSGTTMLGLYQAALQCGMEATGYEAAMNDIMTFGGILILHVTLENGYEHYMVNYGFLKGVFIIWDPASGLTSRTTNEIEKIWVSRKCLAVAPGRHFRYEKYEKREKRKWLVETIKPDKELLIASIFVGVLISVLGVVMAVFSQKLLDKILPSGEHRILIISAILVLLLLSVRVVLTAVRQYMLLSQGRNFNIRIVDGFYSSLLGLPKLFFDTRKIGDMVARLNDTMRIQRVISDIASTYIIDLLIVLITLGVIFKYSPISGAISLFAVPLFFLLVYRSNKPIINSQYNVMSGYALNESNFINTLRGITEIKSMTWQKIYSKKNKVVFSSFQERAFSLGRIKIKLGMLTNLAGTFYLISLLVYTSLEVMNSKMTQGELMAILSLSSTLLPSVMNLALVSVPLNEAKVAIERMFEFTRLKPEADGEKEALKNSVIERIFVDHVSFRFSGQRLLLSDISLEIEKGHIVALVGDSGSGKSTIVNILMRFYQPESGCITINNSVDNNQVDIERWRKSIGLVPQEIHIFNGTILENIIPDPDESKVNRLIRIVSDYGLRPFIDGLPLGFATVTGEDGVTLSGGQKQIMAFMRALFNEPEILLIDEGTSGMDRDTERIIVNILNRLKHHMGILLVTHRINMIRQLCDRIFILEGGRISSSGAHEDLITGDNIYKRFWDDFGWTDCATKL
jgi:ABC-type bacteriocin/lantibiotic exporter with double-glycine peptidase domain